MGYGKHLGKIRDSLGVSVKPWVRAMAGVSFMIGYRDKIVVSFRIKFQK